MRITYLLLLSIVLVCCTQKEAAIDNPQIVALMSPPPAISEAPEPMDMPVSDDVQITQRKLIRSGRIEFRTQDVARTKTELSKICESVHAYLSNETQRDTREILSYSQTIRVPESGFDELLTNTEKLAQHINHRSVETDDVTEEYIDIESRLKAKRELEKRYLELLNKAQKVDDLLQIETEMSKVRSDIESMQGRLNYLRNRVAYSTLNVTYYEEKVVTAEFGFTSQVVTSLGRGWEDFLAFVVRALAAWPMGLVGVMMVTIGMKYWNRRKKRLATKS
jgi:hypothetical protein